MNGQPIRFRTEQQCVARGVGDLVEAGGRPTRERVDGAGAVLAQVGYDPTLGQRNSPDAIQGLTFAFLAGPILFLGLGAASFLGYRLTADKAAETRRLLDERDRTLTAGITA